MLKKILYLLIAIIIGAFVYLRSMNYAYLVKEIELMRGAFTKDNYHEYLRYTNPYFRKKHEIIKADFQIHVFEIIGEENKKAFIADVVFVSNLNEDLFKISEDLYDEADQTNLTVASDVLVYSHIDYLKLKDQYISQSYGYHKYQGYYYLFFPEKEAEYTFTLYDYEGEIFSEFTLKHEDVFNQGVTLEEAATKLGDDWVPGYTTNQKIKIINPIIHRNMLIYGILVILFGLFLFRKSFLKKRN